MSNLSYLTSITWKLTPSTSNSGKVEIGKIEIVGAEDAIQKRRLDL